MGVLGSTLRFREVGRVFSLQGAGCSVVGSADHAGVQGWLPCDLGGVQSQCRNLLTRKQICNIYILIQDEIRIQNSVRNAACVFRGLFLLEMVRLDLIFRCPNLLQRKVK